MPVRDGNINIVRNITPIKARKLVEVVYANFIEIADNIELKHNRKELMRLICSKRNKVLLIMVNNKIAAYLIAEVMDLIDGRRVLYVNYLFTAKQFRKKGFASRLIEYVETLAKEFKYDGVMLTCDTENEQVHNFYLTRGYYPDLVLRQYKRHDVLYKGMF